MKKNNFVPLFFGIGLYGEGFLQFVMHINTTHCLIVEKLNGQDKQVVISLHASFVPHHQKKNQ
jgi:hypothetical protein